MGNVFATSPALCCLQQSPHPQAQDDLLKTKTQVSASFQFRHGGNNNNKPSKTSTSFLRESLSAALAFVRDAFQDLVDEFSGTSVVLSEIEESWLHDTLAEIDAARSRRLAVARAADRLVSQKAEDEEDDDDCERSPSFLGPNDAVVAMIPDSSTSTLKRLATVKRLDQDTDEDDDGNASCTTETTDAMSDVDAYDDSDADDEDDSSCLVPPPTTPVDPVVQAAQLLRLTSCDSIDLDLDALVYVADYQCPCGECPHLRQIQHDVEATVTWRSAVDRGSVARVLCAFATYNEVVGYRLEMVATADECLQIWCGDEDRALTSLVRLYDQLPTCVAG